MNFDVDDLDKVKTVRLLDLTNIARPTTQGILQGQQHIAGPTTQGTIAGPTKARIRFGGTKIVQRIRKPLWN
ncbi:hypothetical protein BY996DRAFT_6497849 [Phakopsora pachyrhizi]|uniref:Uncharacterized protein n=1 Tax=Phakopsora pachyrhizi TaxID=170000 RepID=A0AAV0AG20_PHAPC|nr:hypothetical protein BY996DRAFT_6497849 [Phakopsora pachyrhizi]CAH7666141.1 hypothetical protein PPACK8108_LOCUS475 [Phakopsora pachyrhizi]